MSGHRVQFADLPPSKGSPKYHSKYRSSYYRKYSVSCPLECSRCPRDDCPAAISVPSSGGSVTMAAITPTAHVCSCQCRNDNRTQRLSGCTRCLSRCSVKKKARLVHLEVVEKPLWTPRLFRCARCYGESRKSIDSPS
ncbi:hypothetical protein KUCAC02_035940, partial [Chaenocephalus aceratus]